MSFYSVDAFLNMLGEDVVVKVDFVVTGEVIGVGVRREIKKFADTLGVRGWVANTRSGKVIGTIEGLYEDVEHLKTWLAFQGPPQADILEVKFNNETMKTTFSLPDADFNVVYKY